MGQSASAIRAEMAEKNQEEKQEMEQRLQIMEKMLEQRLETQKNNILNGEKNDQEIDTGTIVSLHKSVYIKKKESPDAKVKDGIHELFSGDFIGGLESIVMMGANTVLANASIGEHETQDMFIVWTDNALLRCDTYYYRWNFVSDAVIKDTEGATGVLLIKRVIDIAKADIQVLTWAITRMADRTNKADPPPHKKVNAEDLIEEAMDVLQKVVGFQTKVKAMEAGVKSG